MSKKEEVYVAYRGKGELVAVIKATVPSSLEATESFKIALQRTLQNWTENSESGREALEDRDGEFSVEDLEQWQGHSVLREYLKREGIENLSIETFLSDTFVWNYDDSLVKKSNIGG